MSSIEEVELAKRRKALDKDVIARAENCIRAMEWDIPEANKAKARQTILDKTKEAINRTESQS
jgi:hypothetical protein